MYATGSERTRPPRAALLPLALLEQRGRLLLWVPLFLALGIGLYLRLPQEPGAVEAAGLALLAGMLTLGAWRAGEVWRPLWLAALCVVAGIFLIWARVWAVDAPILSFRYYGPVEGRIVAIDRSASDKVRLTLDQVRLERMAPERTPERVRISLHGEQGFTTPRPGLRVMMTAHLSPPSAAVEPGGFDFARHAYFLRIGAQGYTRTPLLAVEETGGGPALWLHRTRLQVSAGIRARVPGDAGAFGAAILTGDRSAVSEEVKETLRRANTAHLLAISGLHMGLMTGTVFVALWTAIAAIPWLALRVPGRKWAAVGAIAAGALYLALSGGAISTQRAFIMVAVMLSAILLDRRAISLRAVALAAIAVLIWRPESLTSPGFQMSFAATTALVAVFGSLRDWDGPRYVGPLQLRWHRIAQMPVLAVVLSSAVAGAATAPIAAAHFNHFAQFGLVANTLSVPVMGALVMPAGLAAGVLALVGLEQLALVPMRWGMEWILFVSAEVAALPGASRPVVAPGPMVLPLLAVGALFCVLWKGPARWLGCVPMLVAVGLWAQVERPAILIAPGANLVGILGPEGRSLSKPRGAGFAARLWLENDGDGYTQEAAALRPPFTGPKEDRRAEVAGLRIRVLSGRGQGARVQAGCDADVVVLTRPPERAPPGCVIHTPDSLRDSGTLALWPQAEGSWRAIGARTASAGRPWAAR